MYLSVAVLMVLFASFFMLIICYFLVNISASENCRKFKMKNMLASCSPYSFVSITWFILLQLLTEEFILLSLSIYMC